LIKASYLLDVRLSARPPSVMIR